MAPNTIMVQKHLPEPAVEFVATALGNSAHDQRAVSVSWVQKFLRRSGLKRGKIVPGERLIRDVIPSKVTLPKEVNLHVRFIAPPPLCFVFDQKEGPSDGPQTRAVNYILNRDGAFLRLQFCTCFAKQKPALSQTF